MQKNLCNRYADNLSWTFSSLWAILKTWTEAVAEDATFMIISYGKKECVAIRSREFRTLYISEPLTTSTAKSPPHAKLLVSTFIHSYRDACARVREMERCLNPIGNAAAISQRHADILGPLYNLHIDKENKPTTRNSKASKTRKPAEKSVLNEQSRELQDKVCASRLRTGSLLPKQKAYLNCCFREYWRF